jgi:hypothetical protein
VFEGSEAFLVQPSSQRSMQPDGMRIAFYATRNRKLMTTTTRASISQSGEVIFPERTSIAIPVRAARQRSASSPNR